MTSDYFAQPRGKIDPIINIGKSKFHQSFLDSNSKIEDFGKNTPCPKCKMPIIDADGICDRCKRMLIKAMELEDGIMHFVKDVKTGKLFEVDDVDEFFETYENPENLVVCDVFYSDGAGWNGQISRFAYGSAHDIQIQTFQKEFTNNEMEWAGLVQACHIATEHAVILSDSQLVVNQLAGTYKINLVSLQFYCDKARKLVDRNKLSVKWIPRDKNKAGQKLEQVKA